MHKQNMTFKIRLIKSNFDFSQAKKFKMYEESLFIFHNMYIFTYYAYANLFVPLITYIRTFLFEIPT